MKQREGTLIQVVRKHRQITTHLKEMFNILDLYFLSLNAVGCT